MAVVLIISGYSINRSRSNTMKKIILIAVMMMTGIALAGDPNSMPHPNAQNRVTVEQNNNYTYFIIYTPKESQKSLMDWPDYPSSIEKVIFRYMERWVQDLLKFYESDLPKNIAESKAAREKRDIERMR